MYLYSALVFNPSSNSTPSQLDLNRANTQAIERIGYHVDEDLE